MTQVSSIISITVNKNTAPVSRQSQSYVLLLDTFANFAERARVYTSLSAVEEDFDSSSNIYKMATTVFSDPNIVPSKIIVGRRQLDDVEGSIATLANNAVYTITINGTEFSYTSDGSALATEIATGLKADFDSAPVSGITFTDNLDGTFTVGPTVQGTAWSVVASANISLVNGTATEDWVDSLDAVQDENNDWYGLIASTHTAADVEALAAVIETQRKIYGTSTSDAVAKTVATTDIGAVLKAAGYERTFVMWSAEADTKWPEGGHMARQLQSVPGSNDWTYKEVPGITPDSLTDTASEYLHDKNYTTYESLDSLSRTVGGDMADGTPTDEIVLIDWVVINIRADLWQMMANIRKVPYTAEGLSMLETKIRGVNSRGITNGGIASSPAPVVIMPDIASISINDKANRHVPDIRNRITLAGSIRTVDIVIDVSL